MGSASMASNTVVRSPVRAASTVSHPATIRDPAQIFAQHRRHLDAVARPHALGIDRAHRLDHHAVGKVRDLAPILEGSPGDREPDR